MVTIAASLGLVSAAHAQSPRESAVAIANRTVPESFGRYQHPDQCARDADWAERAFWRARRPDTTAVPRTGQRLQPSTVAGVRACLVAFTVDGVPRDDLLGFGEASLAAEQPADAQRAFERLLRELASAPVADRSWALYQIVSIHLAAARPDIPSAERYLAQLDTMRAAAPVERMLSHTILARVARLRDSVTLQGREATAALAASREIVGDARKEWAMQSADTYSEMAFYHFRRADTAAGRSILKEGIKVLQPLRPRAVYSLGDLLRWSGILLQPAARVVGDRWYPAAASAPRRPVPGTPSLVSFAVFRDPRAFEGFGSMRRLVAAYGGRGVTATFIARTNGYVGAQLTPPDSEAVRIRDYFLTDLALPVTLSVTLTEFGRRSDGRRTVASMTNEQAYRSSGRALVQTYLVDAAGKIRWVAELNRESEATFDDMLREALPQ